MCEFKSLKPVGYVCITPTIMPSAVIRDAALEMMKAIDRTKPGESDTSDEYARDYRLRWSAAMELLRYAELANDFEDDYTDDDDESVTSNDMDTDEETEGEEAEEETEGEEAEEETDGEETDQEDEDYETEASSYCDEEFEEIDSVAGPVRPPHRRMNVIDSDSDDESVYAQY